MKNKKLVIFGSAEIACLAKYYFEQDSEYTVAGFTVDDDYCSVKTLEGLPLVPWSEVKQNYPPEEYEMHVALSYKKLNQLREEKYYQAKENGYRMASYICSKSATWEDLQIGDNCFILENQTIQPTVKIGNNVMIWSGNHIGHGSSIGDHTYLSSHVVVSGHCKIGKRCFLGVNLTLKDFTTIGDDCFLAMDASITKDMSNGSVALGSPSVIYPEDDRRAIVIKKKYFNF